MPWGKHGHQQWESGVLVKVESRAGPVANQFEQTVEGEGVSHVHIGDPPRGEASAKAPN